MHKLSASSKLLIALILSMLIGMYMWPLFSNAKSNVFVVGQTDAYTLEMFKNGVVRGECRKCHPIMYWVPGRIGVWDCATCHIRRADI